MGECCLVRWCRCIVRVVVVVVVVVVVFVCARQMRAVCATHARHMGLPKFMHISENRNRQFDVFVTMVVVWFVPLFRGFGVACDLGSSRTRWVALTNTIPKKFGMG